MHSSPLIYIDSWYIAEVGLEPHDLSSAVISFSAFVLTQVLLEGASIHC